MTRDNLKLRIVEDVDSLIDTYFGEAFIVDKLVNSTLKVLIKININKIDNVLDMFADENGEINAEEVVNEYARQFDGEGVELDIRDFVKDKGIAMILPNKRLLIKKEDILKILN